MTKFFLLLLSFSVQAKSLYEAGLGFVGFHSPHYPGSEQRAIRSAFLPLFIYRGESVYADEEGIKGDIADNSFYKLDLSMAAAFPADSSHNRIRAGMENLDWLVELGPSLHLHLFKSMNNTLDLRIQGRAIFSSDLSEVTHRGYVGHIMGYYEKPKFLSKQIKLVMRLGTIYGSEQIMNYFYEVKPKYVTASRSAYRAKAGNLESHFDLGFIYDSGDKLKYFLGFQRNFYDSAVNRDSPLHTTNRSYSIGAGFTWIFFKSKAQEK